MRSTSAASRPPARTASPLDVEVGFAGVRHDPFLSALDLTAHKLVEYKVRQFRVVESHAPQGSGRRVQGRVPELFRIHLTEALVARDGGLTSALAVIGAFVGVGGWGFGLLQSLLGGAAARAGGRRVTFGGGFLAGGLLPVIALALRRGLELLDRLVPFVVRIGPANLFAQLQPVERWLADVDAAVFHERAEVPIQQGQEQRADVRTVDVGVAEKDRPAVTKLLDVEVVPDPGAERGDERLDLLVAEHLVGSCLLDVEDLAAEREDRLGSPVSAALRAAAGGRTLDDEELALFGVALRAVGEFSGQREAIERTLALHEIACFARRFPRPERGEALLHDALRVGGVLLEVLTEGVVHGSRDLARHFGVAEARLRLPFELRFADLHADDRGEPLADIIGGQVRVWILQRPALSRVRVDRSGQRGPEAGQVRATVDGVDVVRERVHLFGEGVVVLERDLRNGVVFECPLDIDGLRV